MSRGVPDVTHPDFARFWQGCAEGRLVVPRCGSGHLVWPPRPACPRCFKLVRDWTEVGGSGRLYSWTVVHRTHLPWYSGRTPYVVGIVALDLEQTVRMVGRCELAPEDAREGIELTVGFEETERQVRVPYWREIAEPGEVPARG